jgi:aspartyl-tRNA(Asn)/glutamyl-tRNA(Gln) amidotransferase subunit A
LSGDIKGLRIGIVRHLHADDCAVTPEVNAALEEASAALRSLGATLGEARLRPAQDYYDVKVTVAESELLAVHEQALRTRPSDFGEDFLGRVLPAVLISGRDYAQAQRERRRMLAEMAPVYANYDVLVTATAGATAPRLGTWRTIEFWKRASLTTPFNVTGGPALAQCIGFSSGGLPLSMQVVGRPFDDATVLRVAHAYERATPWRTRRPQLDPDAEFSTALPPVSDPEPARIDSATREQGRRRLPRRRTDLVRPPVRDGVRRRALPHRHDRSSQPRPRLHRGTRQHLPVRLLDVSPSPPFGAERERVRWGDRPLRPGQSHLTFPLFRVGPLPPPL